MELPDARFHANNERRFDYSGDTYTTEWPLADEKGWRFFRLQEGTLATEVVRKAKERQFDAASCLRFDLGYGPSDDAELWLLKGEAKSNKIPGKSTITKARSVLNRDNGRCTPDSLLFVANRLLHHAHIVQISGESYRLKDKRKAGAVKTNSKNQ